ncbi:MAG: ABC transporter substrate-binding protein [Deltaproteobacteria bacterium]|nr:ABC transporter substrate-binding protein [Deltaproteobacteria bacterium]
MKRGKWTSLLRILSVAAFCAGLGLPPLAAVAAQPAPPKKILVVIPTEPDTLDLASTRMETTCAPIAENITERLIGIAPDGKLIPGLATSWKVSNDGREIEFALRKNVKFHTGTPFTAQDVKFSHERALKSAQMYQRAMRNLEEFAVLDDYRVRFRFKLPDAQVLPGRLTPIGSKVYFETVGEEKYVRQPVGTGPYRFVSWAAGQYIELRADDGYWGEKPAVKEARISFVKEDTTRLSMLRAGEADLIVECPFATVNEIEAAGFKTAKVPTHPTVSVQFHNYNPNVPWHDRRVRLAIAHAIDGDAIVKRLFEGVPNRYPRLAPWELGYDPNLKPYAYDPEKSKKLLAEAGFAKGFEMPLYYFVGRVSGQKETAEAVALYLNAIGIRCKVEGIEAVKMMEKTRDWHKSTEAVYVGVSTVPTSNQPEPTIALEIGFYSKSPISLYRNPEFDVALERARATLNDKERAKLIQNAFQILHDDVASLVLWSNNTVYAMKKNVAFTPTVRSGYALVLLKDVKPL